MASFPEHANFSRLPTGKSTKRMDAATAVALLSPPPFAAPKTLLLLLLLLLLPLKNPPFPDPNQYLRLLPHPLPQIPVIFDSGSHYGDLASNLVHGFTLIWLPLTLAAVSRAFFIRRRLTNRRVPSSPASPARTAATSHMPPSRTQGRP